eukprot:TRINITY_DN22784_c0_g1_i1.p1 TRINITY_DN22784_c0_g1~~TRINITY_DN22784_c0_g1_i1.p1  ORF type:complete len:209 (+),score=24.03 TRINITY_DN22784_c0_g1_i1:89-715(+)
MAADRTNSNDMIDVTKVIDDVILDMKYATPHNFLGRQVYPAGARCLVLPETAEKLSLAAETLRQQGFRLKMYDCYRPHSVQWDMWRLVPKPGYVADPRTGSNHNRGAAVDLTMMSQAPSSSWWRRLPFVGGNAGATGSWQEVEMPSSFDSFEPCAHHGYDGASDTAKMHRKILLEAMEQAGFERNPWEWWHYNLPRPERFPVQDTPLL